MDIEQRKEMFGEGGYCEQFRYSMKTDAKKPMISSLRWYELKTEGEPWGKDGRR